MTTPLPVLGIDPGTRKCGVAVIGGAGSKPLLLEIIPIAELAERTRAAIERFGVRSVALGGGTHSAAALAAIEPLGVPVTIVDERDTTYRARARYFAANPPRGWKRFVPRGMLLPPRPIDDFAALLIAERLVASGTGAEKFGS